MWSLAVVEAHMGLELGAPLLRRRIRSHVSPLPEQGLNEAFGLAEAAVIINGHVDAFPPDATPR